MRLNQQQGKLMRDGASFRATRGHNHCWKWLVDVSLRFGVPPSTRAFQSSTAVRDGRPKTGGGTMGLWSH